jgi:hypothetical protein
MYYVDLTFTTDTFFKEQIPNTSGDVFQDQYKVIVSDTDYERLLLFRVPGALRTLLATRVVLHIRMQHDEPPMIGMSQDTITAQQTKMSVLEFRAV